VEYAVALIVLLCLVALVVLRPLLVAEPEAADRGGAREQLEAAKEAKYREIRDAELDHAAGKLSDEDFAILDAELRREAVEILDRERV
jgi:hypothetical protein